MGAELVHELRLDLVLVEARATHADRPPVRLHGDPCRAPHRRDLLAALVEAQVVEEVIQRDELVRRVGPGAAVRPEPRYPAHQALIEIRVGAQRVVDAVAGPQDPGQQLLDRADRDRRHPPPYSVTAFAGPARVPSQVSFSRSRSRQNSRYSPFRPARRQYRHGVGLGETGQVVEVAVLAVGVQDVPVTQPGLGCRQDGHRALAHHAHQLPAPAEEFVGVHAGA